MDRSVNRWSAKLAIGEWDSRPLRIMNVAITNVATAMVFFLLRFRPYETDAP